MSIINFTIFLDDYKIGTTQFEKSDASMGVVIGQIEFVSELKNDSYEFFKGYCESNGKEIREDYPNDRLISTGTLDELVVVIPNSGEVTSVSNHISGMDGEGFEITLEGIPFPLYEKLFPNHIEEYQKRFND
jgi:hypothetical protein